MKTVAQNRAPRPMFAGEMHTTLVQAEAIVQVINSAAYRADGADGIGGSCWAVSQMLQRIIDYIEGHFDTTVEEVTHGR